MKPSDNNKNGKTSSPHTTSETNQADTPSTASATNQTNTTHATDATNSTSPANPTNTTDPPSRPYTSRKRKLFILRLIIILVVFLVADLAFLYITIFSKIIPKYFPETTNLIEQAQPENNDAEQPQQTSTELNEDPKVKENVVIEPYRYDKEEVYEGAGYFEDFITIAGQPAYISSPIAIDSDKPSPIIVYSHGSNTTVSTGMDSEFMYDLREYSEIFTKEGYIFSASNQHGANWGSPEAIADMQNLIENIKENYNSNGDIYLIGYSMGGLPTLRFAFNYPENIVKIALLAPTSYASSYTEADFNAIKDIPIKIWHGNADVNVGIFLSKDLVARADLFDVPIELVELPEKGHWDVDTELITNINVFFSYK
ncbi:alpha/beta fold hydrolase [Candidatus Nomurabacteria bacterium]|uniref:Alpha/beta fold hydrolase n=1 Tax=Candidatus Dojkabacteria bacterium TaxID=2099670 RepID=A0A955KXJ4_9BACT|nr:alpha/beta fold hydrolase [Candidatus Dojkabacteria bacterium]MCB9789685.1 alpha/beta fold hydrolase [Candidatus Nomurabacteria bacterium]